jgi:glycosyltransferase involved in cell wall biosynthesis
VESVRLSGVVDGTRSPFRTVKILFYNFSNAVHACAANDPLAVGGAERQQWLLARALAAAGWSVTIGLQGSGGTDHDETIDSVRFIHLPMGSALFPPLQRFASLNRFLRSERPDWWYWRCASHLFGPAVATAKVHKVRTIFAAAFDSDVQPRRALVERPVAWPLFAWGLAGSNRILVQHHGQFSNLASPLQAKAAVVPSMVSLVPATSQRERGNYVAWVGMLRQPKRPDLLVQVARKAPNVRIVVCGGPTEHRSPSGYGNNIVRELATLPNVTYLGQVAADRAREVIANAAALLCTSDEEGFPNTFLEAWAAGTPVVTLTVDPDHITERHRLGAVSGCVDRVVTDLAGLIASPQERQEIATRAKRYVGDFHSAAAVVDAFQRAVLGNLLIPHMPYCGHAGPVTGPRRA